MTVPPLDPTKFAAAKLNFVLGVGLDPQLPKLSLRIAGLFVGRHMKADRGGDAWPAVKTLCGELGVSSERAVREALYALLERGHLLAERKAGETTRYRIAGTYFEGSAQSAYQATPQAQYEPGLFDTPAHHEPGTQAEFEPTPQAQDEPGTQARHEPTNSGNITPGNEFRELNSGKEESPLSHAHNRNELTKGARAKPRSPSPAKSFPEGFDAFWAAYPRKVGKAAAERAYGKALENVTAVELLAGAERFAAERAREADPTKREKYTPHAATWLNAGRWADEPAPRPLPFAEPQGRRERPSIFEMAFSGRLPE